MGGFTARSNTKTAASRRSTGERVDPSTNDAPYILPGFIDLHVHGGGGADVMEGGDAIETITRTHARYGTTSLLATTMTAPRDELMSVVAGLGDVARSPHAGRRARARRASGRSVHQSRQARRAAGCGGRRRARRSAEVPVDRADSRGHDRAGNLRPHGHHLRNGGARRARATGPFARHLRRRGRRAQARRAAASRTCSTRCRRCITAIPAWSARRSRTPNSRRSFPICCTSIRARFAPRCARFRVCMW